MEYHTIFIPFKSQVALLSSCLVRIMEFSMMGYTKLRNSPQPSTTTHNHPQPSTTTHNHRQPPATMHNYLQPPTTTQKTTQNHLQPSATTQKLPKIQNSSRTVCYCTLVVNTETDVGFDTDMKQWYKYMCVRFCVYIFYKSLYLLFFG